jgi:hypothetical protein
MKIFQDPVDEIVKVIQKLRDSATQKATAPKVRLERYPL